MEIINCPECKDPITKRGLSAHINSGSCHLGRIDRFMREKHNLFPVYFSYIPVLERVQIPFQRGDHLLSEEEKQKGNWVQHVFAAEWVSVLHKYATPRALILRALFQKIKTDAEMQGALCYAKRLMREDLEYSTFTDYAAPLNNLVDAYIQKHNITKNSAK